jgi:DGQHR domain-containing protein
VSGSENTLFSTHNWRSMRGSVQATKAVTVKTKVSTVAKTEAEKYTEGIQKIFSLAGFTHIATDKIEIEFETRKSDINNIFIYENIIIMCEETASDAGNVLKHLTKKDLLYRRIEGNTEGFIEYIFNFYEDLKPFNKYPYNAYKLIILYCSLEGVSDDLKPNISKLVNFLDTSTYHYFKDLTATIKKSSKFELFGFLNLNYQDIGLRATKPSSGASQTYESFILPQSISNFAKGYQVVSFYIDPANLIERAYVLRRSGWKDVKILYQRPLIERKISTMREHLIEGKGVFINNIIATLPDNTTFKAADNTPLTLSSLSKMTSAVMTLPDEFNSICIIDGQHRIYSYHESIDAIEQDIKKLRDVQNLLVTAVFYPSGTPTEERINFEANLFVDINSTQTGAKKELIQEIKTIIDRFSKDAIAREVLEELNKLNALKDKMAFFFYEEKTKLKPTTIVTYGLIPLVKLSGKDSLYHLWQETDKEKLQESKDISLLNKYIKFAAGSTNDFFSGFKKAIGTGNGMNKWGKGDNNVLTIRVINGLASCLRLLIEHGKTGDLDYYASCFKGVENFEFNKYGGSNWRKLGQELFKTYFNK